MNCGFLPRVSQVLDQAASLVFHLYVMCVYALAIMDICQFDPSLYF